MMRRSAESLLRLRRTIPQSHRFSRDAVSAAYQLQSPMPRQARRTLATLAAATHALPPRSAALSRVHRPRRDVLRTRHARKLFIQTQPTPNSDAVMFLPGREIMPGGRGTADFASPRAAAKSPLARKLFAVDGVRAVFFGGDFVTVTKRDNVDWAVLRPEIFEVIMDFFISEENPRVLEDGAPTWNADTAIHEDDSEVVQMIKDLIETRVKPAVAEDGGAILYRGFHADEGIVDLELQGACSTCSSSSITLKTGVENMLRHYIPEVKSAREVLSSDSDPLEKASLNQFNKVEQQLKDAGILRS